MRNARRSRGSRPRSRLGRALAALLLVAGTFPTALAATSPPVPLRSPGTTATESALELQLTPGEAIVVVGNETPLTASWSAPEPGCELVPVWFSWSLGPGTPLGALGASATASNNFTATVNRSGTQVVRVDSSSEFDCGEYPTVIAGSASANISVVAPLNLAGLAVGPGPSHPGATVNLTGAVLGGLAPYAISIDWSSGNRSSVVQENPGSFSFPHAFEDGRFAPQVWVHDALGASAMSEVREPLEVGSAGAVEIVPPAGAVEVGVPIDFSATFSGPVRVSPPFARCDGSSPIEMVPSLSGENFTCEFSRLGLASVLAGIGGPNDPVVWNSLVEPVEPALSIVAEPPGVPIEAGRPADIAVRLEGGVPPLTVSVAAAGLPGPTTLEGCGDGPQIVPITLADAGPTSVVVNATDALGVEGSSTIDVAAAPRLNPLLDSNESLEGSVSSTTLATEMSGGVAPYLWSIDAPTLVNSSAPLAGIAGPGANVVWSGLFDPELPGRLNETVIDALGANATVGVSPLLVPLLSGNISIDAGPPGTLAIAVRLAGGVPPFTVWANVSGVGSWSFTVGSDGESTWAIGTHTAGLSRVTIVVVDRYDLSLEANSTVVLAVAGSPSPTPIPLVALGFGILGVIGLGWFFWRRHRSVRTETPPPIDPEIVLRRILEPADGADRSTVELLAEEAGIPLTEVHAAIDRLVDSGKIRSETSPDGEEVLAWSEPPSPG